MGDVDEVSDECGPNTMALRLNIYSYRWNREFVNALLAICPIESASSDVASSTNQIDPRGEDKSCDSGESRAMNWNVSAVSTR